MSALTLEVAGRLRLSGRVLDHDGEPLAGALVELQQPEVAARSGEDGRWEIVPPPGTLLADVGGLVFRREGFVDWRIGVPRRDPASTAIDVGDVRLGRPTTVSGRVVDDRGQAVAGVRISIIRPEGGQAHERPWLRSGSDGSFVDENTPEGELELRVVLIEETRDFVEPREPLRVRGGDQGVVFVLERRPWNEGRVVAEITDARTGAPLDALRAGVRRSEDGVGRLLPAVELSAGRVTVDRIEVGRYLLWVQVADRPLAVTGFEIEEGASEVFLRIPVEEAGSIRGQLLGGGGAEFSIAYVELELQTSGGSFNPDAVHPDVSAARGTREPDAEGRFHWEDLTPGRWQVFVRCGDEVAGPASVEVRPGEVSELELRLEPGARLIVEVGPGEPGQTGRPRGFLMFFVTTCTDGGTRRNMGYMVPLKGPAPGSDERSLRVVLPRGRTEYEIRLGDLESEPVARGVVELEQGEEHRISL